MQAFADRGYFNGNEIKACTETGITPLVPKPMTSTAKAGGRFGKADFIYPKQVDQSQRPAGERAIKLLGMPRTIQTMRLLDVGRRVSAQAKPRMCTA